MSKWINVEQESKFSEPVQVYEYKGIPIAVFKLEEGYFAINDTCSHEKFSLSEGDIDGCEVECPLHGAVFDIKTGKNLSLPAVLPVKSYPVKVEDGNIMLEVDE